MDEENSDEYDQEECLDPTPSAGLDKMEDENNETDDDIAEVGTTGKEIVPDCDHLEPCVGMEFESYLAAGRFYGSYARSVGFETKIRQSRSNRDLGKWYVQFACNREGFRRPKPGKDGRRKAGRSDKPDVRCGCSANMKVKLVGRNKWTVLKVDLVHNHPLDRVETHCKRPGKHAEGLVECGRDGGVDPSTSMEGVEEDPDDMEEEISENNAVEMEKDSELGESAYVEPAVGMEFESYVSAGKFYNSYARHVGFETKIRQSRSNLKHGKRYVQFSCNREGFKRAKIPRTAGTRRDRPDSRCGCLATMKIKLTGQNKWKVFYVNLMHNHEICPVVVKNQRSQKLLSKGVEKRPPFNHDLQALVMDNETSQQVPYYEKNSVNFLDQYKQLELDNGDLEAMRIFFDRMQARNPNFFYSLDLNDEGNVRNVFWVDSRSRAAYEYFGDVVTFDTTYLTNYYKLKLVLFVGANHHGQRVLLGCGLLSSMIKESFSWFFRAWLMAMSNHSPYAIISDQMDAIDEAVSEVFPHSHYRFCLWKIMERVSAEFSSLARYNEIKKSFKSVVYDSLRVHEFEQRWSEMITKYALEDDQWLQTLYDFRDKWVPGFLKCGFWAGMSSTQNEKVGSFFDGYLQPATSLQEFFEQYELALNGKYAEEAFADFTNFKSEPTLEQAHWFEAQLVDVYTADIFRKFQQEVNGMVRCYDMSPVHLDDTITTYILKERVMDSEGRLLLPKEYEVFYKKDGEEVTCICNLFQFEGFLCRHSLYILQNHGVVEIPSRYIIARWRKDYKHNRSLWYHSTNPMPNASTQWHDVLHQKCQKIVEEGALSERGYFVALQVLDEGLQKVVLENDATVKRNVGQANSRTSRDIVLENSAVGNSAFFYSLPQDRSDGSNNNRLLFDHERTANSQKRNSGCTPIICESCMAADPYLISATNACKKKRILPAIPSISNCNPASEILVNQASHDFAYSTAHQGTSSLAPYYCAPPAHPVYVPFRYPSALAMADNGFIPFNQVLHLQQAHEH